MLNLEFAHDFRHALQGGNPGGNQRKAQHVLNESHFVEHRFHACGITIDKEQGEKVGETMVYLPGRVVFTPHLQANHLREFLWQGIADDRDDAYGTT